MPPSHRLFFALLPSPSTARAIGVLRGGLVLDRGEVAEPRLHLTLGIAEDFPEFPADVAHCMRRIGDAASGDPLRVVLDRLSGSPRSVALRPSRAIPGLRAFHGQLHARLRRAGLARTGWRFSPHVTLGYRDGAPFQKPVAAIGWEARDFVLIHSIVGRTIHRQLARWPLAPRQHSLPFA